MKAILVIDMPKSCKECFLCGIGGEDLGQYVCSLTGEHSESPHLVGCPLRPLPQKKVGDDLYERYGSWTPSDEKEVYYRVGFNDCLDEITGETE